MAMKDFVRTETIMIHKAVGKERKNCVYAKSISDIPKFLIGDGSIIVNSDDSITLYAVEGPVDRVSPVFICWEPVSAENKSKVPGVYGCWPKDNGQTTLKDVSFYYFIVNKFV